MRNIVFIGCGTNYLDYILEDKDNYISLLLMDTDEMLIPYVNSTQVQKTCTMVSFYEKGDVSYLNYEDIQQYKDVQFRVESSLSRCVDNFQELKYVYYKALAFWLHFFRSNTVDYVILTSTNHGGLQDEVAIEVAKRSDVMCYTLEPDIYKKKFLLNNTTDTFVKSLKKRQINKLFKSMPTSMDLYHDFGKATYIKRNLIKIILKIGGPLLLEVLQTIKKNHLLKHTALNFHYTLIDKIKGYIDLKKALYYALNNCSDYKKDCKYIFYSINLDPDASGNSARHDMESQLVIVEMLAKSLPEGWVLYIKDHPHYLLFNTYGYDYFLNRIGKFRNRYFYEKILSFSNVRMVHPNVPSEELVKYANGVAMLQGTNSLYALQYHKPLMLFSSKTPINLLEEVYTITSFTQCEQAILEIEQGKAPLYEDIGILDDYLIDQDEDEVESVMAALYNDWKTNAEDK